MATVSIWIDGKILKIGIFLCKFKKDAIFHKKKKNREEDL